MAKKIGDIHITRYDNDTRIMDAGFYPSLEDMAHDVGNLIDEQIPKVISNDERLATANELRDYAYKLIRCFAEGMHAADAVVNWHNPENELPMSSSTTILFALKSRIGTINAPEWVYRGYYSHDRKKFIIKSNVIIGSEDEIDPDEVACWMLMPFPISFAKEE